jgi:trans-aconitate 2-methyltransferase
VAVDTIKEFRFVMISSASVKSDTRRDWDPALYMKFEEERIRAARDLLARVPLASASVVYDLGCGPGSSAELLADRFPDARITGLDTSEAMVDHARTRVARVRFVQQDIADWTPDDVPDLIFANGVLQFLPEHDKLFPRLASMLPRGGVFAAQMPSAARESSHALMRMVAAEGPWWSRLASVAKSQPLIAAFEDYYEWLRPVSSRIELWSTTYVYAFDGADGIVDWFAGSPLQPFLERLSDDERCAFLDRYRKELSGAYPTRSDGKVLFAYPRLFIVATRG